MRRLRPRTRRRAQRDPSGDRRRSLISLGRRAIRELSGPNESEASLVFEDGLRTYYPEIEYLADTIQSQRGWSGERLAITHAVNYLERLPLQKMIDRALSKVIALLDRAWDRKIYLPQDDSFSPFVRYIDRYVKSAVEKVQMGGSRDNLVAEISSAFSDRPPVQRLAVRIADAIYAEAKQPLDD